MSTTRYLRVNKYTVVQLDINQVKDETEEVPQQDELSDAHLMEAVELLKPVVTKKLQDVVHLKTKQVSASPAFLTGTSIRLGYKFLKRNCTQHILLPDDADVGLFEERLVVYISLKSTGTNPLRKILKTGAVDKKKSSGAISDYFTKSQASKSGEGETSKDDRKRGKTTRGRKEPDAAEEGREGSDQTMMTLRQIMKRQTELTKKKKGKQASRKTTTSEASNNDNVKVEPQKPVTNTITSYCMSNGKKHLQDLDLETKRSDEACTDKEDIDNSSPLRRMTTRLSNQTKLRDYNSQSEDVINEHVVDGFLKENVPCDDRLRGIVVDLANHNATLDGGGYDSDIQVLGVGDMGGAKAGGSEEHNQDTPRGGSKCLILEKDSVNMGRDETALMALLKAKPLKSLTSDDLRWLVKVNTAYLVNIFSGRRYSARHEAYKKGDHARKNLMYTALWGELSEEQVLTVMDAITKIFCKKHMEYLDYIELVLHTEMLTKVYVDCCGVSHDHAVITMKAYQDRAAAMEEIKPTPTGGMEEIKPTPSGAMEEM